jgi:hypothetical protein
MAVVVSLLVVRPATVSAAPPGWSVTPSPNASASQGNDLNSTTCVSATECWAVGEVGTYAKATGTLIERWDGASWTIVSSPSPEQSQYLLGVACSGPNACWAVGVGSSQGTAQVTVIERWDGTSWTVVTSPGPTTAATGSQLAGVACASASDCWATGSYSVSSGSGSLYRTLVEHWDGSTWTTVTSPNPGSSGQSNTLYEVTCASAAECWSVGYSYVNPAVSTLIERWDGSAWTAVSSPNTTGVRTFLQGVTCTATTDCWAVGWQSDANDGNRRTVAVRWDGTAWNLVTTPNSSTSRDGTLGDISCTSAAQCWAVGFHSNGSVEQVLIEQWNGSAWTLVPAPTPGTENFLNSVACAPICFAVGASGSGGTSSADSTLIEQYVAPQPATYHAVTPYRLADTRTGSGQPLAGQHLGAGAVDSVPVVGVDGVPAGATAAVLNVTATNPTTASYLTVYPGPGLPLVSNLNVVAGQTVANLVTVPIGGDGHVDVYNQSGNTDVVVDLEGYFVPGNGPSGLFNPLPPLRIADTRAGSGAPNAGQTLGAGDVRHVQVDGAGGVPSTGVQAVVLNVTATGPSASSYLTAYPGGADRPLASNLNFTSRQVVPNRVIVPVVGGSTPGTVDIYNLAGSVDVAVDVTGWFTDATAGGSGARFTPVDPTRVADTRPQSGQPLAGNTLGQDGSIAVSTTPAGPSPNAVAVAANVTVVDGTASSYLTVYPGANPPVASDLNWTAGEVVPNLVITGMTGNEVNVYNRFGSVDVVVDVFGFWS